MVGFQEPGGRIVATLTEEIVSRTASSHRGALDASAINGVDVSRGGELIFEGPHQITGNGNPTNGSGIRVERSSLSLQNGATVQPTSERVSLGDAHSGIVLSPTASVTNNSSTGIRLRHQSLVGLTAPVTIQGNGGVHIACDSTSLAYGQLAGITGVQCDE